MIHYEINWLQLTLMWKEAAKKLFHAEPKQFQKLQELNRLHIGAEMGSNPRFRGAFGAVDREIC